MKYVASINVLLVLTFCFLGKAWAEEYALVWSDEFEVDGEPNQINWRYEQGFVRNKELQYYQPENVECREGLLVIEGRRERRRNSKYQKGSKDWRTNTEFAEYTSGSLNTKGLHDWQYGIFEVRARIKTHNGLWPGIWFMGVNGKWPTCGEIDLMEYYGGHILANACWGPWDITKIPIRSFNDHKWDEKFHIWKMHWDSDSIRLYMDDQLLNEIDIRKTTNAKNNGPKNPFRQPHYLLINLAIGGLWGGNPSNTQFPTKFEIDYVRVFQKRKIMR